MQKHTKLETGDHVGGGRRRTSASPAPPVMQRISHVHLIRRGDFGHALRVRRAPYRRCPPQNGDEKLRPASNRCWAEFCDSSRAGAAAFSLAILCGGLSAAVPMCLRPPCSLSHAAFAVLPARHASNRVRIWSFRRQNAFITGHDSRPNTMRMSALCRLSFCRLKSVR